MVWKWHSIDTRLKSEWTNFWLHVTHTWIFLECAYFWLPMSPLNYDSPRFALNSSNHFLELSHNTKKQRKDILVLLKWPVVKKNLTMFSMHTCVLGADWACINKSKTCSPSFGVPFVNLFFFSTCLQQKKSFISRVKVWEEERNHQISTYEFLTPLLGGWLYWFWL